jgi:hypothetical protein
VSDFAGNGVKALLTGEIFDSATEELALLQAETGCVAGNGWKWSRFDFSSQSFCVILAAICSAPGGKKDEINGQKKAVAACFYADIIVDPGLHRRIDA